MRKLYNESEIVLCTYIAKFGRNDFNEKDIVRINNRSLSSIKMKVKNIAFMIDEFGGKTSDQVSKLSGLPEGQTGRKTNWDLVKLYVNLSQNEHRKKCIEILTI